MTSREAEIRKRLEAAERNMTRNDFERLFVQEHKRHKETLDAIRRVREMFFPRDQKPPPTPGGGESEEPGKQSPPS